MYETIHDSLLDFQNTIKTDKNQKPKQCDSWDKSKNYTQFHTENVELVDICNQLYLYSECVDIFFLGNYAGLIQNLNSFIITYIHC